MVAFPIVGIGCSAGGLEALEKFFSHAAGDSGAAYVVIQHLDPNHTSALPQLLQRLTSMPVAEAQDAQDVRPNCIYVIPPNTDLSIVQGKLLLVEPVAPRGRRLPIDLFLRSLAEDSKEKAVGVILSGMGSDGILGLRAIKEQAGLTLAQDPASAQADSMPRSAIEAGVADIVAPPEALPGRIAAILAMAAQTQPPASPQKAPNLSALDKIIILLREHSGNDFSLYKTNTLRRRIERRMAVHQLASLDDYLRHLGGNPSELDLLFKELLIGVTNFFRDPEVWEALRTEAIPALLADHPAGKGLRAWVPACATGEEAYSLAIAFKEALDDLKPDARFTLQIYATDLDAATIELARKGRYPDNITADVSPQRLGRYFTPEKGGGYRIRKEIREMVVFATQNIISDPPFSRLDILSCRNLLIYFGSTLQKTLLPMFHYALNPGGILVLGSAETVGHSRELFVPLNGKARIFRQSRQPHHATERTLPATRLTRPTVAKARPSGEASEDLGQLTDQLIQQHFSPAAVLVNHEGDILYVSGRTGKYLEPAAGKTNINLYAMAREGLREALVGVVFKALKEPQQAIELKGLKVGTNGGTQMVDVTVQAISKPEPLNGRVLIVFRDVPAKAPRRRGTKTVLAEAHEVLQLELLQTREALQAAHEEMQTAIEELKSSNEELQSSNEELQSTNEELTTSKGELQSVNEELQSANEELSTSKEELLSLNDELRRVNARLNAEVKDFTQEHDDMANLLNSTEIATVFLDNEMHVRRFTTHATRLFKLIPGDVGRPLSDIATDLDYPRLKEAAIEVHRTLVFHEQQVRTADGRWFRARIMPYRTQNNVIDGVVMTFMDITEIKQLEAELRQRGA